MYNILVAINDSPLAKRTMEEAISICHGRKEECLITLLHIKTPRELASQSSPQAEVQVPAEAPMQMTMQTPMQATLQNAPDLAPNESPHAHELEEKDHVIEQAVTWLDQEGIQHVSISKPGDPAREICNYAEDYDVNLIVLGRQDKGPFERLFMGSVSKKVVESSPVTVMVVK